MAASSHGEGLFGSFVRARIGGAGSVGQQSRQRHEERLTGGSLSTYIVTSRLTVVQLRSPHKAQTPLVANYGLHFACSWFVSIVCYIFGVE